MFNNRQHASSAVAVIPRARCRPSHLSSSAPQDMIAFTARRIVLLFRFVALSADWSEIDGSRDPSRRVFDKVSCPRRLCYAHEPRLLSLTPENERTSPRNACANNIFIVTSFILVGSISRSWHMVSNTGTVTPALCEISSALFCSMEVSMILRAAWSLAAAAAAAAAASISTSTTASASTST